MVNDNVLMLQSKVPLVFRRHGNTTPKPLSHVLGPHHKSLGYYARQVQNSDDTHELSLENAAALQTVSTPYCPNYVAQDKKVLRFGAYFLETVHESNMENYRVRTCEILYYLEDDSLQIAEPKVENSGLVQGNFIRRHPVILQEISSKRIEAIPANGSHGKSSFQYMNVGKELTIWGRTFRLIWADTFTRNYMRDQHIELAHDEEAPQDVYTDLRKAHMSRETGQDTTANYGKKQYEMKEFMEARLGRFARPRDHLKNFLDFDRMVLRFYALWDDTEKMFGTVHRYIVHVYLSDNTVEILETYERNSGRDPFPKLLNRTKLSRNPSKQVKNALLDSQVSEAAHKISDLDLYTWRDFQIGEHIVILQRKILLLDADQATRKWYEDNDCPLQDPITVEIGSLPIAHGSLHEKKAYPTKLKNSKKVFRYRARLETTKPEDIDRQFIISVYESDETVSIMEPVQRNAGFVGGKFLERMRVPNSRDTTQFLGLDDFYIGAHIGICGQTFLIFEMDAHTAAYKNG